MQLKKSEFNIMNVKTQELLSEIQLNDICTEIERYITDIERALSDDELTPLCDV